MTSFFKELFEYSHHFNQKLYDVFSRSPDQASDRAIRLFNHILNAHQIWNNRIEPKQPTFGVWDIHPLESLKSIDQANYAQTLQILDQLNLSETIHYVNSKGEPFSNSIRNILFHVINHSTYHRGQIATAFRQHGIEPLVTDYIYYKRNI